MSKITLEEYMDVEDAIKKTERKAGNHSIIILVVTFFLSFLLFLGAKSTASLSGAHDFFVGSIIVVLCGGFLLSFVNYYFMTTGVKPQSDPLLNDVRCRMDLTPHFRYDQDKSFNSNLYDFKRHLEIICRE